MRSNTTQLIINLGMLLAGIATLFSGVLIQLEYHIDNHGSITVDKLSLGIAYRGWTIIHKVSIVTLSVLVIYHIYKHWKWYKGVIKKRLFGKNQQVLVFSVLFILVAITGLTPWLIDMLNGSEAIRKTFIEIHDKLTLVLAVYVILHIIRRLKWYFTTIEKIKSEQSTSIAN